jgi:hypothetical protein
MERLTFVKAPIVSVAALSLPPMHVWPTPIKRIVLGACITLCIIAYAVMAVGIFGLATLVLGLL